MIPIIAPYTVGNEQGLYETAVHALEADCESLGLEFHPFRYEPSGTWLRNTLVKPHCLQRWVEEHGAPVILLDADSRVWKYPKALFEVECEIGLVPVPHGETKNPHRVRSSPVVVMPGGELLVEAWAGLARESGDEPGDHALLNELVEAFPVSITLLPETYSHIGKPGAVIQTGLSQSKSKRRFFRGRRDRLARGVPGQSPPDQTP